MLGAWLAYGFFSVFGVAAYLLPLLLAAFGTAYLLNILGYLRERLRWSVRHAYEHNPHYRKTFTAAGFHPDQLKTLDDLRRIPCLTKQEMRDKLLEHKQYIRQNGEDMPEIRNWKWGGTA